MLKGANILLVEDEMMVALLLESVLESAGYHVTSAGYVEQAIQLAIEGSFDVAVLDVNLHGQRSYPVADALAARHIPFLFATAYGDVELIRLYPSRPVLAKPFKPRDLLAIVSSLIAGGSVGP